MKIFLHHFKNFHFVLLFLALTGNVNGQCSIIGTSPNASTYNPNPCVLLSGCAGVLYIGDGVNPTNLVMSTALDLTCLGSIQLIVRNNASIDFSSGNDYLTLATGSSILFEGTGTLVGGSCNASERIYIGNELIASCNGNAGADYSFPELVGQGGFNIVNAAITPASVCGSGSFSITAAAIPSSGATIRWYTVSSGGSSISTANPYTTPVISATTTYYAEAYYSSTGFSTPRKAVVATVNPFPVITTQPITQLDCEGASVNFTVVATGTGLTYTWQRKKPTDVSFMTIPVEGNISYPSAGKIKIDNVGSSQSPSGTQYQVVITTGSGCSVTSSAATLLVNEITGISPSATTVTQCNGTNYSYTVSTSTPPPGSVVSYQWKSSVTSGVWNNVVNGTHFSGANSATLNILNGTPAQSAEYKVQVIFTSSGANCNVTTALNRQITFLPEVTPPVATITQPTCTLATGSVELSGLPAAGTWTLTRSGTSSATTTGTGTSATISGLATGTYNFTVFDGTCTSLASADVVINTQPQTPSTPTISSYTMPTFADNDGTITLDNLPTGAWVGNQIKDGGTPTTISGTGSSYTITGLSYGSYEFEVVGVCVSPTSAATILTTVPYTPAVSAATAIHCAGFTANWPATPTATSYLLDVSTVSNFATFVPGFQDLNVGNVLTYPVAGMPAGTLYYRIRAQKGILISLYSATVTISPLAATNTWTGFWSNGTPNSGQNLVFNSGFSSTADVEGCSCTVAAGAVTFNSGHTLKITNWVQVNGGSLTFENNASLVQINNVSNTNSGNIRYKRQTTVIRNTDYTYWSSPVAGFTLGGVSPNTLADKYYSFDSAIEDWKQESAATTMVPGIGYVVRGPQTSLYMPPNPPNLYQATFVGVPHNGHYEITGVLADKSCLLGNPYPSALDANTFLNDNQGVLDGTLYFWTHNTPIAVGTPDPGSGIYAYSGDDYATYNQTGGTAAAPSAGTGGLNTNIPSGKIASGQGFFGSSKSSITGSTIVFNNSMRVGVGAITGSNDQFFKTGNPKEKVSNPVEKNRVWLDLTNIQGAFKQTLVGYVTDATNDYEDRFDGVSLDGNDFLDFYSINQDKNLAIQGRALPFDENDQVPLGYRVALDGIFTIKISLADGKMVNQDVFLEDKVTNTISNLKNGNYTFNTIAGTFNERFVLRYKGNTPNKTLSVDETKANDGVMVLYSNNYKTLIVRNKGGATINSVTLFNILGQKIIDWDVEDREQTIIQIPIKNIDSEIYIVKVKTTQGETSKKIVIK